MFTRRQTNQLGALVIVPGSSAAAAYWEAAVEYPTLVDGAVSDLPDIISTNNATQSTAANRPVLSRADNLENRITVSSGFTTPWSLSNGSLGTTTTSPVGTAVKFIENTTPAVAHAVVRNDTVYVSGVTYNFSLYAKADGRLWILPRVAGGAFGEGKVYVNLSNGAKGTETGVTAIVTDAGSGWYRISFDLTATSSGTSNFQIYLANGNGGETYTGDGTSGVFLDGAQVRRTSTSSTYIATTTFPQYAGINGNAVPVFDGSNDSLATTIAVNPTGGMWGAVFVRPNALADGFLKSAFSSSASNRLLINISSTGTMYVRIYSGAADFIQRSAPASSYAANEAFIFSWTYDGTTAATGIKLYKNGTRIDTSSATGGAYVVPTAGDVLVLGEGAGVRLNGYLSPAVFGQGSTWADADRQATEQALRTKYIPNYVWFNPANNVTSDAGAVASWTDVTNTYVASQSTAANRPAVSTLNGQVAFLFDGTNDSLATSLAVNPTGGMAGVCVARSSLAADGSVYRALSGGAGSRFVMNINSTGSVTVQVWNTGANRIGRVSNTGIVTANEVCVLSWTYDGGTATSGIKIYKNGVQIDSSNITTGAYTVPATAGDVLQIGGEAGVGGFLNGYIVDAFFVQGRQMSDSERQGWESRFMEQYGIS